MTTPARLDVPGLIRRVRRQADLSQRDLAAVLEVDQSMVARWETGALIPALPMLERILEFAGYRLAVLVGDRAGVGGDHRPWEDEHNGELNDEQESGFEQQEAVPMRQDAVRDRQRRRFPSHLDVHDRVEVTTGRRSPGAPWRHKRDRLRERAGAIPPDHPTLAELLAERQRAHERRRAALGERLRSLPSAQAPQPEPCTCPEPCWEAPHCDEGCPCSCEPRP
ncbi:MAG: helix-turn-helix transcriptional regulator, partial [Propionibacteriaceae bacterium]|nr:helix-turn-helix transcriptional regulator [Propionibacteriaceae bacterium]